MMTQNDPVVRPLFAAAWLMACSVSAFASEDVEGRLVQYDAVGVTAEGYYAAPEDAEDIEGGILIVPNWMGPGEYFFEMAREWAEDDFAVFVVDMYGQDTRPTNADEAGAAASAVKNDRLLMRARVEAGLVQLQQLSGLDSTEIAAMGFCFGGTSVLELARAGANVPGVIAFHGSLDADAELTSSFLKAEVLVMHGAEDPLVPDAQVLDFMQEMRAIDARWNLIMFGGAVHSFTNPNADWKGTAEYHPAAAERAWEIADEYLEIWLDDEDDDDED